MLQHDLTSLPNHGVACGAASGGFNEAMLRRLAAALSRSLALSNLATPDLWAGIVAKHQSVVDLFAKDDLRGANDIMSRLFASPLTYGFEQGEEYDPEDPGILRYVLIFAFDRLLSLAEAMRAIPIQNSEQGQFAIWLQTHPDELIDRIEERIGRPLPTMQFQGGLYGVVTKRGLMTARMITAIYVALRVAELARELPATRICEIGGGAGYVAYYCHWLGVTDYTLVDLPTVSAAQAYFLAQNLGAERISLSGEPWASDRVKIIGTPDFVKREFDLIINVDSFPEIGSAALRGYLRHPGYRHLLSINQEAMAPRSATETQERVGDVIEEIGGFKRLARFPFWMRPGYAEEMYRRNV